MQKEILKEIQKEMQNKKKSERTKELQKERHSERNAERKKDQPHQCCKVIIPSLWSRDVLLFSVWLRVRTEVMWEQHSAVILGPCDPLATAHW